jgi:hypothetical protein
MYPDSIEYKGFNLFHNYKESIFGIDDIQKNKIYLWKNFNYLK